MSSTIERKIVKIQKELAAAINERDQERGRKKFKCCCGRMHAIKDCEAIQTHWYTKPQGCTSGDYWNESELRIICPGTNRLNRILFEKSEPWDKQSEFQYSAETQFKLQYKNLFKKVIDNFSDDDECNWTNNYYFDENHAKFGIKVKSVK